jgi:hypothetical protein
MGLESRNSKIILVIFIVGFFVPGVWLLALMFRTDSEEIVASLYEACLYAFFIECAIVFLLLWGFLIFFWNWAPWVAGFIAGSKLLPGEIYACIFVPILALVIFVDIISKYFDQCKCKKKVETTQ